MPQQNDIANWPWRETLRRADTLERQTAVRAPSVEADVRVPLQQAFASGWFGAVAGAALAVLLLRDVLAIVGGALAGFVLVAGAAWFVLLADHRRMLWEFERATVAPSAQAAPAELRVAISHYDQNGRFVRMEYLDIPGISEEQLKQFARRVTDGAPLAVTAWTGRGGLFSRSQYDTLMSELMRAGLVPGLQLVQDARGREYVEETP